MRHFPLDGAELWFERATGLTLHHAGPSTAASVQRAPRVVQFGITNACNLRCGFCSRDATAESRWDVESAFELLAALSRAGTLEVAFGGGEPLAFRGFDDLVVRLHEETELAIGVTTNGELLTPARAARLAACVSQFRVSIYDDGNWRQSFAALRGAGSRFGANLLVDRFRAEHIEEVVLDLVAHGAEDVLLLNYVGSAHAVEPEDDRALGTRVLALARVLRGRADVKLGVCWGDRLGVPRLAVGPTMGDCGAGRDFLVVTSDRAVQPCSFHPSKVAITTADDVLRVWRDARSFGAPAARTGCARTAPVMLGRRRPGPQKPTVHAYAAWASNNSGSYTLVGRFDDDVRAQGAAELLTRLFDEMREALAANDAEATRQIMAKQPRVSTSEPLALARFVEEHGLSSLKDDVLYNEWPYLPPYSARAAALGRQLVVHVGYTVSMPRALEEFLMKTGGRLETEIAHAHAPLVVVVELWWPTWPSTDDARATRAAEVAAFRAEIDPLLPSLVANERDDDRPPVPHAWKEEDGLTLAFVASDPVDALLRVRAVSEEHGVSFRMRCFEALSEDGDPLAQLR